MKLSKMKSFQFLMMFLCFFSKKLSLLRSTQQMLCNVSKFALSRLALLYHCSHHVFTTLCNKRIRNCLEQKIQARGIPPEHTGLRNLRLSTYMEGSIGFSGFCRVSKGCQPSSPDATSLEDCWLGSKMQVPTRSSDIRHRGKWNRWFPII